MSSKEETPDDALEFTLDGIEAALELVWDSFGQAISGMLRSLVERNPARFGWHRERAEHLSKEIGKLNIAYDKLVSGPETRSNDI